MKMNRCGAGDTNQCNRLDNFVDPSKYLAVFSPVPAAVGGRVKNTDAPGETLTLDELKQWLQGRPPVCESDTDCLPNDSRKLDQQGNSVIETYTAQAWTEDQGCAAPPCTSRGAAVSALALALGAGLAALIVIDPALCGPCGPARPRAGGEGARRRPHG